MRQHGFCSENSHSNGVNRNMGQPHSHIINAVMEKGKVQENHIEGESQGRLLGEDSSNSTSLLSTR